MDDRGLLDMMTAKTRPGGHILLYRDSNGRGATQALVPAWQNEQRVERLDDFKTLQIYRKKS